MYNIVSKFTGDYRFLSNFWPIKIERAGIVYPSVEHAYQAGKVLDVEICKKIANLKNPAEAKKVGSKVKLRDDWEQIKTIYMEELLWRKFNSTSLEEVLLNTKGFYLMEGNYWHDNYWGVCLCSTCYKNNWGQNMLGQLLMKIRDSLLEKF